MFKISNMDFIGNKAFEELLNAFFPGVPMEHIFDGGVPGVRVYVPSKGDSSLSKNKDYVPKPAWRNEVRPAAVEKPVDFPKEDPVPERKPKSILEMLEDGDERLEKLLGKIIDKRLAERNSSIPEVEVSVKEKNPFVYIANRLTFLIQTKFPLVFDTSIINNHEKSITIAVNEDKTIPKINDIEELGFITSEVNRDEDIQKEIAEYLEDTCYGNIYCFPTTMSNRKEGSVAAVKFVVYPCK